MVPLPTFQLPLQPFGPPSGYGWGNRALSNLSTTTAFNTGINGRDVFLGIPRCVVCGINVGLSHGHIIMRSEQLVWSDLKNRRWIPSQAKVAPAHEPRDGLLLCPNHHTFFDTYLYFIRYCPDVQKFVLINYSDHPVLRPFHGKAIALDITDPHAPFPSVFIIHEMRVRGHNPFQPVVHNISDDIPWQDWILTDGVFDNTSGSFVREAPNTNNGASEQAQVQFQPTTSADASSGGRTLALSADVMAGILAATRAMPSWKACQMEGTSWTGTAEENIQKYVSSIGI